MTAEVPDPATFQTAHAATIELVDTPRGPARLHHLPGLAVAPVPTPTSERDRDRDPDGDARPDAGSLAGTALVLGHGAGGSVTAPDLLAVTRAVTAAGANVVLVEQPYRVAGRRTAPPAAHLDEAWLAVLEHLAIDTAPRRHTGTAPLGYAGKAPREYPADGRPAADRRLVVGGRSSGARVACRTDREVRADGVLCLAFPLFTPKGASRQDELDGVGAPVLVIQGTSDRFGQPAPDPARARDVVTIEGDHGLKRDLERLTDAVLAWLPGLPPRPATP